MPSLADVRGLKLEALCPPGMAEPEPSKETASKRP